MKEGLLGRLVASLMLGLLSAVCMAKGNAEPPVSLVVSAESIPLTSHVAVLRDDSREWTLEEVLRSPRSDQFVLSHTGTLRQGFTPAAVWYRVALRNPLGQDENAAHWVLELQFGTLDYVDLHVTRSDGSTQTLLSGDRRQAPPEQLSHRSFAFPLHIAAGEEVMLHLRVLTEGAQTVPLAVWTKQGFEAKAEKDSLWIGAFIAIMLVMALYNLAIFLMVRDRAYLYYVLYILSTGCMMLLMSGYARRFGNPLFESAPIWINAITPAVADLACFFGVCFVSEFLQLRRHASWARRLFKGLAVFALAFFLLTPVLSYIVSLQLAMVLAAIFAATAIALSIYLSIKGVRAARFFLLAWAAMLVAAILVMLDGYGVVPIRFITPYGFQVAICLDVVLLSLALADRINIERKEKLAARELALIESKHVSQLKSFLPQQVAELVTSSGNNALLQPKRRHVTVCVIDLRGFTPFSEQSAPEDVMNVLREFFTTMGNIVEQHGGTVEHFAGDSMVIFFNAPLEIAHPESEAVQTALEMRGAFESLRARWIKLGHDLGLGIGLANGHATIGAIGFLGRQQYAAIGAVTNLAARLCASAKHGEILTTSRVYAEVKTSVDGESLGEQTLRGFSRPVEVVRLTRISGPAA